MKTYLLLLALIPGVCFAEEYKVGEPYQNSSRSKYGKINEIQFSHKVELDSATGEYIYYYRFEYTGKEATLLRWGAVDKATDNSLAPLIFELAPTKKKVTKVITVRSPYKPKMAKEKAVIQIRVRYVENDGSNITLERQFGVKVPIDTTWMLGWSAPVYAPVPDVPLRKN